MRCNEDKFRSACGEPVYLESFAYRDQTARLIYASRRFLVRPKKQRQREKERQILTRNQTSIARLFFIE